MHHPTLKESAASKKFWFAVMAVVAGFVFALLACKLVLLKEMYSSFTGLLEFITSAYLVGNVANKFVLGNASKKKKKSPPVEQPGK